MHQQSYSMSSPVCAELGVNSRVCHLGYVANHKDQLLSTTQMSKGKKNVALPSDSRQGCLTYPHTAKHCH